MRDKVRVYTHMGSRKIKMNRHSAISPSYARLRRDPGRWATPRSRPCPVPYTALRCGAQEVRHTEKLMIAIREALGEEMDMLLDFHGRPSSIEAAMAHIDASAR